MKHYQTKALVALGGNIGNVRHTLEQATSLLDAVEDVTVLKRSSQYLTEAIGGEAGASFLNSAVTLTTSLEPEELLDELQRIENELGRIREKHWGPRVIDLDLILYGTEVIQTERLLVPHPASFYRRFVLDPANEIADEWLHPGLGLPLSDVLSRIQTRPLEASVVDAPELLDKLLLTANEEFHFTEGLNRSAAIVFHHTSELDLPQGVSLDSVADDFSFVQQVLTAATDEPQRMHVGE